jgi:hypothetical protein
MLERLRERDAGWVSEMPPATNLLGVYLDGGYVRERDLEPASQRPQPVEPFDLENGLIALY